jgi:hypothetical protein
VRALLGTIIIESHTKEECARGNKVGVVVGGKERCRRQRSWISGLRTIRIVWLLHSVAEMAGKKHHICTMWESKRYSEQSGRWEDRWQVR